MIKYIHAKRVHEITHEYRRQAKRHNIFQSEWERTERDNSIQRKEQHLPERIFGYPGNTSFSLIRNFRHAKTNPPDHPADKAVLLTHLLQGFHTAATQQPEISRVLPHVLGTH